MINVFTNSKKIIDTGSVIQFENEDLVFNIEDLQFAPLPFSFFRKNHRNTSERLSSS